MKKLLLWIIIFAVAFVSVLAAYGLSSSKEISAAAAYGFKAEAALSDINGIDTNSSFILSFGDYIKTSQIRKYLSVTPVFDFEVHQGKSGNEALIVPLKPLEEGVLYRFTLTTAEENIHFAFESKKAPTISGHWPKNEAVGIPLDTEISLYFNAVAPVEGSVFNITPHTEGYWRYSAGKAVFSLAKPLLPATIYQVAVYSAQSAAAGENSVSDYVFSFETASDNDGLILEGGEYFFPDTEISFELILPQNEYQYSAAVEVYSYDGGGEFFSALSRDIENIPSWSNFYAYGSLADKTSLTPVIAENLPLLAGDEGGSALVIPRLAEGFYLLRGQAGKYSFSRLFQVSSLKVSLEALDGKNLLRGEFPQNQPAYAEEMFSGAANTFDSKGEALFAKEEDKTLFRVESGGKEIFLTAASERLSYGKGIYLYCDRRFYAGGDKVYYWGIITPSYDLNREESELFLENEQGYALFTQLPLWTEYSFSGSFNLENLPSGTYKLVLREKGLDKFSAEIQILPFGGSLNGFKTDKNEFIYGEDITLNIYTAGFEGLKLPGFNIRYGINGEYSASVLTNSRGEANINIPFDVYQPLLEEGKRAFILNLKMEEESVLALKDDIEIVLKESAEREEGAEENIYVSGGLRAELFMDKNEYICGEESRVKVKISAANGEGVSAGVHLRIADARFLDSQTPQDFIAAMGKDLMPPQRNISPPYGMYTGNESALFLETKSGDDGIAVFDFIIPGNEGEYFIDCLAFNDFSYGAARKKFYSREGASLEMEAASWYSLGDKPIFSPSFSGEANFSAEYRVEITEPGANTRIEQIEIAAGENPLIEMNISQPGEYSINLHANTADYKDTFYKGFAFRGESAETLFPVSRRYSLKNFFTERNDSSELRAGKEDLPNEDGVTPELILASSHERSEVIGDLWRAAGLESADLDSRLAAESAASLLMN
jgi:hypothetical protein